MLIISKINFLEQKVDLLIGESTSKASVKMLNLVNEIYVKGKEKGLRVYTL